MVEGKVFGLIGEMSFILDLIYNSINLLKSEIKVIFDSYGYSGI